jgi:hypothetical protein
VIEQRGEPILEQRQPVLSGCASSTHTPSSW